MHLNLNLSIVQSLKSRAEDTIDLVITINL